jgi:glycerol-3-phosphate acyltransferase PlsY
MGTTNVLRTLGKVPALFVLAVDVGKGILALWLARHLLITLAPDWHIQLFPWINVVSGLAAIVGHSRPVWLGFKGGKSVATSLGILFALFWPMALAILGVWGLCMGVSRIVSLSSIVAAITAPILAVCFGQPLAYILFTLLGGIYVVLTHRRNIERLLAGTEPAIGRKLADQS